MKKKTILVTGSTGAIGLSISEHFYSKGYNVIINGKCNPSQLKSVKKKFKSKYCVVVSNGTAALHLALISIGLKKNEIVCSSPISFLAGANMVKIIGGKNFFIDRIFN